ncbi:phage tail protein, partial [Bartonella sp. ML69XJBT]|uniref:phage tail protein n=1 Tax=Bartonella sp. ML69XJBT TaxID=3019092 RepID=UPI00236310DD
ATELGAIPLLGGEIQQGCIYSLAYDESLAGWHLLNPTPVLSPLDLTKALYPAGFIGTFAMQAIPSGWLLCDGSAYSRSFYSDLFAAIGITWGSGDGIRTFNIPDLRGMFLRGFDDGRNIDTGRSFASVQPDLIQSHQHEVHKVSVSDMDDDDDDRYWHGRMTALWGHALNHDQISTVSEVSGVSEEDIRVYDVVAVPFQTPPMQDLMASRDSESETRPINVSVVFAIKT